MFKLLRLPRLLQLIDPKQFTNLIKEYYKGKLKRVLSNDEYKNQHFTDHNHIMKQIMLGYIFRVVRMILVVFSISYFIGTLWFLICWQLYLHLDTNDGNRGFIGFYGFDRLMREGDSFSW